VPPWFPLAVRRRPWSARASDTGWCPGPCPGRHRSSTRPRRSLRPSTPVRHARTPVRIGGSNTYQKRC